MLGGGTGGGGGGDGPDNRTKEESLFLSNQAMIGIIIGSVLVVRVTFFFIFSYN